MNPILSVFETSPDRGRGLARDMRVRWALEEVGQPYDVRLVSFAALKEPAHRARNPFGQIPTYQDGDLTLFESGAIVLHIAGRHPGLLPVDVTARTHAIAWIFAAIDTVEPPIFDLDIAEIVEGDKPWHAERQPMLEARVRKRLDDLAAWIGEREWLEDEFAAGDLMMVTVLRRLHGSDLLAEQPRLAAYVARGEARPAFTRAFVAQRAVFETNVARTT